MVCQVCQASCNPSLSSAYIIRTRLETATRVHRSGYPRLVRFYQRGKYQGRASRPSSDSHGRPHRRDRGQGRWRKRRHYGHRPDRCPASLTTSAGLTPGNGASTPCFSTRWNHSAPGCLERGDFGGSRAVRSVFVALSCLDKSGRETFSKSIRVSNDVGYLQRTRGIRQGSGCFLLHSVLQRHDACLERPTAS